VAQVNGRVVVILIFYCFSFLEAYFWRLDDEQGAKFGSEILSYWSPSGGRRKCTPYDDAARNIVLA
jgi:hypothetical protein